MKLTFFGLLDLRRVIDDLPSELGPAARLVTLRASLAVAILVEAVTDLMEVTLEALLGAAEAASEGQAPPLRGRLALPGGSEARLLDIGRLVELATGQP